MYMNNSLIYLINIEATIDDVRFGSKVGQIGPKRDKAWIFLGAKMHCNLVWEKYWSTSFGANLTNLKSPGFVPSGANLSHLSECLHISHISHISHNSPSSSKFLNQWTTLINAMLRRLQSSHRISRLQMMRHSAARSPRPTASAKLLCSCASVSR